MSYDMLLGREFFFESKIKLMYHNGNYNFEYNDDSEENIEKILPIYAVESKDKYDIVKENLDDALPTNIKDNLISVLRDIDEMSVELVENDCYVRVHLKDLSLFRYAPRRMSIYEKQEVQAIVDDLLKRNIIKSSISPYCSRVVLVSKRDGKKRMCIDLRPLNQRIFPQKFPFPIIEDQLDQLYGKRIFTKLDLRDGFHQISIHPDDTKYFAFATPYDQYEYTKLPFGYSEAPAEFQKRLAYILNSVVRDRKILLYMDDILIPTVTIDENIKILEEVLILLKRYSLELNLAKCLFLKTEIEHLGYLVSAKGITMSQRHVQAILDFPQPKTFRQLQGFLELTRYFRKFIKDYTLKARPLQLLTKKNAGFDFTKECVDAFEQLKKELTSSPVLHIYNPLAETELHTDASSLGFGAILLQRQQNGKIAPIAYFSRATTDAEKKYHSYELKTLAIVKAIERFHIYLQGIMFRMITDCNSLALAMKKVNIIPRIAC